MPLSSHSHPQSPFDHRHYVAVLRCKQAEKGALKQLPESVRTSMTPLIEIPRTLNIQSEETDTSGKPKRLILQRGDERVPYILDAVLRKTTADIKVVWGDRPIWLDLQHLFPEWRLPDGRHPVEVIWNYARADLLFPPDPVPVVTLRSDAAFLHAVRTILEQDNVGVVLRLHLDDLEQIQLTTRITNLLSQLELTPARADLVVDFGSMGESGLLIEWMCSQIPYIEQWRTFSCVGSSFPENLIGMPLGQNEFPRHEWNSFSALIQSEKSLPRTPAFGDYGPQYGSYVEPIPNASPTASIRYTTPLKFVVMKGQSTKVGAKSMQYPANAELLRGHEEFRSLLEQDKCAGDDYIEDRADRMLEIEEKGKGTGNSTTWLQASLNRHWSLTTKQLSTLFDS